MNKKMLLVGLLAFIAGIAAAAVIYFCLPKSQGQQTPKDQPNLSALPDPPVGICFRPSSWFEGYVMQLTNTHSTPIMVTLFVVNEKSKQENKWSFPIPFGEMKEIGMLEVNWHFDPGERGYVEVQGYRKKLYYELLEGGRWKVKFDL